MADVIFWVPSAAIAAGTPYTPPAAAGAPRVIAVESAVIIPATSGATTNPVEEVGVVSGQGAGTNGAPAAGQVTVSVATQQFVSGDAIPANGVVLLRVIRDGEAPKNP